jgi:hypothetical protein
METMMKMKMIMAKMMMRTMINKAENQMI